MVIICRLNLILPRLYLTIISGLHKNYMDLCSSVSNLRNEAETWETKFFPEKHHPWITQAKGQILKVLAGWVFLIVMRTTFGY